MVEVSELRGLPIFADLPDDQLAWFISQAQEITVKPDETYLRQGDPADAMFVFLEGQFEMRGDWGGQLVSISLKRDDVGGVLPYSRMKEYPVTARAVTSGRILRFPASRFPDLIQKMPELTSRLVARMSDRIREATKFEQQRDRLAALGKLSAGLAHELNNPASAAKRAASQLRALLKQIKDASHELGARDLTSAQKAEIEKLETSLIQRDDPPPDTLTMSRLEDQLETLLRGHGHNDLWQLAGTLARKGTKPEVLEPLLASLDAATARAALVRISASLEVAGLLNQIESSTSRISDLVGAIKEYTFMDQAPVQNVDIIKSLETTLIIMHHKLKRGVTVERNYQPVPLLVDSFGSELNQVWTNIIDNAIDAMAGKGQLRIRTYRDDGCVVVEIGDNGPGIQAEIQARIFEPFFTTKGVGEGTGLGLDTVQRIVRRHRGSVQVSSQPGDTRFQVLLPMAGAQAQKTSS
jgi:signal transduction histidine kinase